MRAALSSYPRTLASAVVILLATAPPTSAQTADQPPTISPIADVTVDENQVVLPIRFEVNDPDDPQEGWAVFYELNGTVDTDQRITGTGTTRQLELTLRPFHFGVNNYTIFFESKAGSRTSTTFRLTVRQVKSPPVITRQPPNQGAVPGRRVLFVANAGGEPAPTMRWQVSTDGGVTWADTGLPNTLPAFIASVSDSGKQFRAVFTNSEGSVTTSAATLTVRRRRLDDMDGDGLSDLTIWRGPTGGWFWLNSSFALDSANGVAATTVLGDASQGDVPLTGDFDGNGLGNVIIWRPSTGTFFSSFDVATQVGQPGDEPFLGDVNGDGSADYITWRPSDGTFRWRTNALTPLIGSRQWGNASLGDRPLVGDFDADGKTDFAVWRASNGTFYWLLSSAAYSYEAARAVQWGNLTLGDTPLLGDLDGDGRTDLAVWRAGTGTFFWLTSSTGYAYPGRQVQWGNASLGDVPMLKEIDGDGADDLVVWRASTGSWFWLTSSTNYQYVNAGTVVWGNASLGDRVPRK